MLDERLVRLGRILKAARVKRHLTQDEIAEMAKTSKRHLTDIEKGRMNASFLVLYQLFETLQVPLEPIFYPNQTRNELDEEELLAVYRSFPQDKRHNILSTLIYISTLSDTPGTESNEGDKSCTKG